MEETQIKCTGCGETFAPDLSRADGWTCPKCQARNPDLRLHYRVLAGIAGLGFVGTVVWTAVTARTGGGMSAGHAILLMEGIVLLAAALLLFSSHAPWASASARAVTNAAFGAAFVIAVLWPVCMTIVLSFIGTPPSARFLLFLIPVAVACCAALGYLVWVQKATRKCRGK